MVNHLAHAVVFQRNLGPGVGMGFPSARVPPSCCTTVHTLDTNMKYVRFREAAWRPGVALQVFGPIGAYCSTTVGGIPPIAETGGKSWCNHREIPTTGPALVRADVMED